MVKQENGITLAMLVITIIVMLILAGVSMSYGSNALGGTKLKGFYSKLEIIQKRVDEIATNNESYTDENGNVIYLKEQGTAFADLDSIKKTKLQSIIQTEGISADENKFRYFSAEEVNEFFELIDFEYNVFVDFDDRVVIAANGININGKTYYTLKTTTHLISQNTQKNVGTINSLKYNVTTYGDDKYKIIITPSNTIGDLSEGGKLKYKKTSTKYWETSTNLEMVVDELTQYNIQYEDMNKNKIEKIISLEMDSNNNLVVTEI